LLLLSRLYLIIQINAIMRFRYLILLISLLLVSQNAFCQKGDASPTNLDMAKFLINNIRTQGIIVRLRTNKDRIAAYRKAGNIKVASKMEEKANATNLILMYAFLTQWSYCPIYFMESQYTSLLINKDTLIAKTFDLKRDTAIYLSKDSFYIIDYGVLMENEVEDNSNFKDINKTEESNNPSSYDNLVVKDHNQKQFQAPMPYFAKVFFPELTSTDYIEPISLNPDMTDSLLIYLQLYPSFTALIKSPYKGFVSKYLDSVFTHIDYVNKNIGGSHKVNKKLGFGEMDSNGGYGAHGTGGGGGAGNPFQKAVKRLNKSFIDYYCKRLDKDRNLLSRDDVEYWWQRNPNIRYFPYLHDLEVELKAAMETSPKNTK
jgi:hypothetical protein